VGVPTDILEPKILNLISFRQFLTQFILVQQYMRILYTCKQDIEGNVFILLCRFYFRILRQSLNIYMRLLTSETQAFWDITLCHLIVSSAAS
jgi:hypothetical protein